MKPLLTLTFLALMSASAMADDAKSDTLVVSTNPAMRCENCAAKIKKNIRFVKGTKKIDISVPQQTVTIIYDGKKTTYADYEAAFQKIGYKITPSDARKSSTEKRQ